MYTQFHPDLSYLLINLGRDYVMESNSVTILKKISDRTILLANANDLYNFQLDLNLYYLWKFT